MLRSTRRAEGSAGERILSIFEHDEVLFGDASFIPANRATWLERLDYFVAKGEPVQFVSMAFPYKVPNPLKNDRAAPDLGEALMLRRFQAVLDAIKAVYAPGGVLTILEEGISGAVRGSIRDGSRPIGRGSPMWSRSPGSIRTA